MIKKLLFLFVLIIILIPQKSFAQSTEQILSFSSNINLNSDASIDVREEIKYYFSSPRHGIYRYIPYHYKDENVNRFFKTPIQIISVKNLQGNDWPFEKSTNDTNVFLKIGDKNKTVEGEQTYIISYKVLGVINYFDTYDELYWNVTGNDFKDQSDNIVPINKVSTTIILPEGINKDAVKLSCFTGDTGSKSQDCQKSFENGKASFSAETGPLTIVVGFNKGIVPVIKRDYDLSLRHESNWYWLILPLTLLLLLIRYFRSGRDTPGRGTIAPEFEPPNNLSPGEMGTLVDEKADNKDISAMIINLAVKGFLKIKEDTKNKYSIIKINNDYSSLDDIEKTIMTNLFSQGKIVKLSDLHENLGKEIDSIQSSLYDKMIDKKYFIKNPEKVRTNNCVLAVLFMILPWGLFWFSWNLVWVLFLSGILIALFTKSMPKKTREGAIVKEKSLGFREFLFRAERYRVKWQEKENIFEKYLPYAMVFGIADKWAENFKDLYKKQPDWYEGGNWTTFNTVVFVSSLNSFNNSTMSSFSPPVSTSASSGISGFSGSGGFSGGGFGGGGGGSW